MLSRSRALLLALTFLALAVPLPASAAETSNSEFVIIRTEDVLSDDLYAGAIKVTVEGTIDGDLIAFAAEEVIVNGSVTGSVFAMAPTVEINGSVGGSVRMAGGSLSVRGEVGRDVVASAFNVNLSSSSTVSGEVIVWALKLEALGAIDGDLGGGQRTLNLAGSIGGDVDVTAGRVVVVDALTVGGDLDYRSSREAEGLEMAEVTGTVVHKTPVPPNIRVRALGLLGRFLVIVFLTLVAMTVAWGWPDRTKRAIDSAGVSTLKSWGAGALVLSTPLIMSLVAALVVGLAPASASFPLLAILVPLIIATVGLVAAISVVAGIPAVGLIGRTTFSKLELPGSVLAGSAVVSLVWLVPIVGWLVPILVLPVGLGGWILSWNQMERSGSESQP